LSLKAGMDLVGLPVSGPAQAILRDNVILVEKGGQVKLKNRARRPRAETPVTAQWAADIDRLHRGRSAEVSAAV
jgi:hypothetical protein